jgi:diguanylate cyclase (GGDEF)-like protein
VSPDPWRITLANSAFASLCSPGELQREPPVSAILHTTGEGDLVRELSRVAQGELPSADVSATLRGAGLHSSGTPVELRLMRLRLEGESHIGMRVRPRATCELSSSAHRDPLTGLCNRLLLTNRLDELLGGNRVVDQRFALLFVDLNHFKAINDEFGHLVGDRVLREAARRLESAVRAQDKVYRYGGDEFVVLIENVDDWEGFVPVIERLQSGLEQPMEIDGQSILLSASVGVAVAGDERLTPEDLVAAADRAMYAAKRRSRIHVSC